MPTTIRYEQDNSIVTITLDQPERRNPISEPDVIEALLDALRRAELDSSVKVIILTGAGRAFSSGGDLHSIGREGGLGGGPPTLSRRQYLEGIQRLPVAFADLEVPVIAAVNGPAIGAGCDLACMCDIRIAAESAKFAESFVKLGLIPGDGGAWLLQRTIGFSKAAELTFTGDILDANAALACGLVSRVVPDDDLMPEARSLAARIAANPGDALRMAKRLMSQARSARLDEILHLSAAMQSLAHTTADHREAIAAFLEKRPPRFTGA